MKTIIFTVASVAAGLALSSFKRPSSVIINALGGFFTVWIFKLVLKYKSNRLKKTYKLTYDRILRLLVNIKYRINNNKFGGILWL